MKTDPDFGRVWGGIAGVQHLLPLMLTPGLKARGDLEWELPLDAVVRLCAERPAARFRLRSKGRIAIGADADLTLIDPADPHEITADALQYRHGVSPWIGRRVSARVRRTLLRGRTVYHHGELTRAPAPGRPIGRLITPS